MAAAALVNGGRRRSRAGRQSGAWGRGAASRPGYSRSDAARRRRRRTAATWPAPGGVRRAPRAGERGGGTGPHGFAGPKGMRVGPAAPVPFSFF